MFPPFALSVLILLLTGTAPLAWAAGAEPLSCNTDPGNRLCQAIDDAEDAIDYTCTGLACSGIFESETLEFDRLVLEIERMPAGASFDAVLVGKARALAQSICNESAHGDPEMISRLVVSENTVSRHLADIQRQAGIAEDDVVECIFNVN